MSDSLRWLAVTLAIGVIMSSCGGDTGGDSPRPGVSSSGCASTGGPCATDGTTVSFAATVQPILNANCVSCHGPSAQNGGVRLDGFSNVQPRANQIVSVMRGGRMPPSGCLAECDIRAIERWVSQGSTNN